MTSIVVQVNSIHIMRIEKQPFSISIENRDVLSNNFRKHGKLFEGNSKRGLIVGPSGYGETNVVISLIKDSNSLLFTNYILFALLNKLRPK